MDQTTVWREADPDPGEARRGIIGGSVIIAVGLVGFILFAIGIATSVPRTPNPLVIAGLAIWMLVGIMVPFADPYLRVPSHDQTLTAGSRVFHLTTACWEVDQALTLDLSRSKRKQFLTRPFWFPRLAKVVYFFPQRPTARHARGQTLAGGRRAPRYLYELELMETPAEAYRRGAAIAVPADLKVRVVARQTVPERTVGGTSRSGARIRSGRRRRRASMGRRGLEL